MAYAARNLSAKFPPVSPAQNRHFKPPVTALDALVRRDQGPEAGQIVLRGLRVHLVIQISSDEATASARGRL
jgi:hypothetical protein